MTIMLERFQSQTKICNKSQIIYLVKLLSSGVKSYNDLKLACNSFDYTFSRTFDNLIILLAWINLIRISKNKIELLIDKNLVINSDNMISNLFFNNLFKEMNNTNLLIEFFNSDNIKYQAFEEIVTINNNLIYFKFSQFRNLLIDLEFLVKDNIIDNYFLINNYYKKWFIEEVIPLIDNQMISKKMSLSNLKKKQKQKELLGLEAEKFVFSFERKRLSNHVRFNDIKIISEDRSNAGYDIQSFNNDESIIFDRFIEVKSFDNFPNFFWSNNEVKVADQKQNNYFLYLVDRSKISQNNYTPLIIQNPYINVLLNDNWTKEVDKWFVKQIV